ncbi:MAG TPA: hypothetical protein VFD03_06640, partial [Clostridia bacterium]|nr:hypothetical protein [Clostridia bacterium]
ITPDLNASDKPKYIKFLDTLKEYGVTAAIDIREYGIDMFGKSARRISMLPFSQRNIKCLFRGGLSDRFVKGKYGPIRFSLREESIDLNKYEEEYRANLELEIDEEFINFIRSHGKIAIVFEKHFNMNNEFRVLTETLKEKCNLEEIINL